MSESEHIARNNDGVQSVERSEQTVKRARVFAEQGQSHAQYTKYLSRDRKGRGFTVVEAIIVAGKGYEESTLTMYSLFIWLVLALYPFHADHILLPLFLYC